MRNRDLFVRTLAVIAGCEIVVMVLLGYAGMPEGMPRILLDAFLLSVSSALLLYLLVVKDVARRLSDQTDLSRKILEKDLELSAAAEKQEIGDQLLSLMNNIPGIVYRGRRDWTVSFIGAEVEPITGYTAEEFMAGSVRWNEIIHPDDLGSVKEAFRRAVRAGEKVLRVEYRIRRKDGKHRWLADRRQLCYDKEGGFLHVDGLLLDITGRKRGEEALREAIAEAQKERAKSEAIVAAIGDGISIQDRNFRILYQNQVLKDLVGEHLGEQCHRAYQCSERICERCPVAQAFADGNVHTVEKKVERNGETSYTEITASTLRNDAGTIVAGIEVVRDITERRKAEEDRLRLAMAVEQTDETIVITDVDGVIRYVNPAFERLTGYTRGEAVGRTPKILKSGGHDEAFYRNIWTTLGKGETWSGRIVNRKKNGELFEEDARISPVRDASGKIINFIAAKRDITRIISLEKQVRTAQRMESVGTLAGGIAHDFNNALTGVLGFSEILRQRHAGDPKTSADLDQVIRSAEQASTLTRQLLTFARRQVIEPKNLSANRIVADLSKLLSKVIGEHIEVKTVLHDNLPSVFADPGQMEQVLMNLCLNARDAMPSGGRLVIETDIAEIDEEYVGTHPYMKPGRFVLLSVSDTGVGMDERTRERAFEPFFTTKGPEKGTGLGLSVVYGIVKQHSGFIHLYSEPGRGTTFKIHLPAVDAAPDAMAAPKPAAAHGGRETILLAEDDESVRKLAERSLKEFGYRVLTARNGEEAIGIFERNIGAIDLTVLDLVMPRKGGKETFDEMRKADPALKVLYTSGYSGNSVHESFVLNSAVPFLQKPFGPGSLARKVREVLDSR